MKTEGDDDDSGDEGELEKRLMSLDMDMKNLDDFDLKSEGGKSFENDKSKILRKEIIINEDAIKICFSRQRFW